MNVSKSVLAGALKVLGKVASVTSPVAARRSIRFVGTGERVVAWATDGVEMVAVTLAAENEGAVDFAIEYGALRELVRTAKGMVELQGKKIDWPEIEVVPKEAVTVALPRDFTRWMANAAQIVDREDTRRVLQGIHLSPDGITAANGKQLLHIPVAWSLERSITLPFPLALLTARVEGGGTLTVWNDRFQIEVGDLRWLGQAVPGQFSNWKQVMPQPNALDYAITIRDTGKLVAFLKTVPDHPPFHAIEFNVGTNGVTVIPADFPELSFALEAEFTGVRPRAVLALNKHILLRMLQQGYNTLRAHSEGQIPVVAEGGDGQFVAMPLRVMPPKQPQAQPPPQPNIQPIIHQEAKQMDEPKPIEAVEPINLLDELNAAVDELRGKLKTVLDESAALTRKVKEAVLQQKQKEREFLQARRAIERIKLAI